MCAGRRRHNALVARSSRANAAQLGAGRGVESTMPHGENTPRRSALDHGVDAGAVGIRFGDVQVESSSGHLAPGGYKEATVRGADCTHALSM